MRQPWLVMYLLYSLTLTLFFVVLLPYFAYKSINSRKYFANLRERLGNLPAELRSDGRPTIWVHAVSVGEALAAIPLINALRAQFDGYRIVVSTTTITGQTAARTRIKSADAFCYFPIDWRFSAGRSLRIIKPVIVILMESELWPNFLRLCGEHSIPVLVANGRISDRSFRRARPVRFLTKGIYTKVSWFAMQSEADAERARVLGAPSERVSVSGNLKYDVEPNDTRPDSKVTELESLLSRSNSPLVIAGSTSEGEEEILLSSLTSLRQSPGLARTRLLIAPRHPERFERVAQLLEASGLRYLRRSALWEEQASRSPSREPAPEPDVVLLDSIGELSQLFRLASVVFIGGSLVPKGGHNILEPALQAKPIVVGPHMDNFRDVTARFLENSAMVQLHHGSFDEMADELTTTFKDILTDTELARRLGLNAQAMIAAQKGATPRIVTIVEGFLGKSEVTR